jgi:gamma-glutamylcyclotransferase (GGCT)/AIG2-like uncharacterized protein YtfP
VDVFVYGTLTDADRADAVLDSVAYAGSAVLSGLHRVDGRYPTLAPGGRVEGRLLGTPDVAALDRYEGVDRGLYERVAVPLGGDDGRVAVYVGNPDRLDAPVSWPGTGSFAARVRAYIDAEPISVRPL